jgi:predicted PurR-regulated permease PerM
VTVLLFFLATFLLLLIVFRAVLFPFLMAIFIAYLIEPVVAAFTRAPVFGIRWTRGPTIFLMYAMLLTGIVFASSCAVAGVAATVREVSADVADAVREEAQAADFSPDGGKPFDKDVRIPAGVRVVIRPHVKDGKPPYGPPTIFSTWHDTLLPAGEKSVRTLLQPTKEPTRDGLKSGSILPEDVGEIQFTDDTPLPEGAGLSVSTGDPASGLEVWLERNLVGPILNNLAAAGYRVEPVELREFIAAQAAALGGNLPKDITTWGKNFAISLVKSVYEFFLILMLTAFIVMDRKRISAFFASLPPESHQGAYQTLIRYIDRGLAGVIRGQLVICLVNGVLTYCGLLFLGVKAAVPLAAVAGVLSLIPIFGTIVSSIPIVLVALTDGLGTGVAALGWILLIHLLEANVFNPLIMGTHANMHPVIIIFALLAGEHSFGVWGALLAVPTASIIQSCFLFYRHEIEGVPPSPEKPHGEWLRKRLGSLFARFRAKKGPEGA